MGTIYSNIDSTLIRYARADTDIFPGLLPIGTYGFMLQFDDTTNPSLLADIANNFELYRYDGITLSKNSQPVTINPDGAQIASQKSALTIWRNLPDIFKTGTPASADAYLDGQIFGGQTVQQLTDSINAQLTNITIANVAQINARLAVIRTLFIQAATAIVGAREALKNVMHLLIVIRDLIIRFRNDIVNTLK